jgi:hypothetical protein
MVEHLDLVSYIYAVSPLKVHSSLNKRSHHLSTRLHRRLLELRLGQASSRSCHAGEGVRLSLLKLSRVEIVDFLLNFRSALEVIRFNRVLQLFFQVGEVLAFVFVSSYQLCKPSSFLEVLVLATTLFKLASYMFEESDTVVRRG